MRSRSGRAEEPSPSSSETLQVARIVRPHGIRGELKIEIHSDVPDRFATGRRLLMRSGRSTQEVRIGGFRPHKGGAILRLDDITDRNQAEALRGAWLEVPRAESPAAPPGAYYFHELIGCSCSEPEHGELGDVVDLIEDGGGYLLRVETAERSLLVPFVEAYLGRVDIAARHIELRLPAGLVEACSEQRGGA